MSKEERKSRREIHVNELHSIKGTREGSVLRRYLESRLEELAYLALSCPKDRIELLQGQANEVNHLLKDLIQGPTKAPNATDRSN